LLVSIGSTNPAKVKGASKVVKELFPDAEIRPVDTSSITRLQPVGLDQIMHGAIDRARFAHSTAKTDLGIGIEAGVFALTSDTGHLNLQLAAIVDNTGRLSIGSSAGFPLPPLLVEKMLEEGKELDSYSRELTTTNVRIREEDGIVFHLTKGSMSRVEMSEQCVRMALVPWLNRELYGL
jgi:inosine/xanthosine triphosphatase